MASLPALPQNNSFHVRSISLPSSSHPLVARVEEEIKKLEAWRIPKASSSPSTVETICNGLGGLGELYDCIQQLLHMPLANHQNKKWADDALDGSLRLLDMYSTTRDILLQMKEQIQSLGSALRRRGESSIIRSSINAYISSTKRVKKDIKKCLLKLTETENNKNKSNIPDQQMSTVAFLLRETRVITISFLQSMLSLLSASRSCPKISSKWSLLSRLMNKGQGACSKEELKDVTDAWRVDIALHDLLAAKDGEMERVCMIQRRLEAFEVSIKSLESGLERMLRLLMQNRVSLLNIFSQ